jgi:phosphoheptose isomerase
MTIQNKTAIADDFKSHLKAVETTLERILPDIERGVEMLWEVVRSGQKLFLCGNGGSAADAQHFSAEWLARYKDDRPPLPAQALTCDTSTLTAVGNDYGFEKVFSRQLKALGKPGDLLIALTTSGQSPNIVSAISQAKKNGMKVIALSGERGITLSGLVDLLIVVPSAETARIQEIHELIYHSWCACIDSRLAQLHLV